MSSHTPNNVDKRARLVEVRQLVKELGPPTISNVNIEDLTEENMEDILNRGHIGVAVIVCQRNGEFVFVRHRKLPNQWMTVGGKVEGREGILEAVVREVKEETGLEVEVKRLLLIALVRRVKILFLKFLAFETGGTLSPEDEEEVIEARAFKKGEMPKENLRFEEDKESCSLIGIENPEEPACRRFLFSMRGNKTCNSNKTTCS